MDVVAYSQFQELGHRLFLGAIILPVRVLLEYFAPGSLGKAHFVYIQFPLHAVIMFCFLQHTLATCVVDVSLPPNHLCEPPFVAQSLWFG